mmetsp:Transcript_9421/g.21512  ORF Transcript_9421/g.21512 Transcript_9421/m.21512 type:complete len:231 (-) Transcript_9421:125-817(-)
MVHVRHNVHTAIIATNRSLTGSDGAMDGIDVVVHARQQVPSYQLSINIEESRLVLVSATGQEILSSPILTREANRHNLGLFPGVARDVTPVNLLDAFGRAKVPQRKVLLIRLQHSGPSEHRVVPNVDRIASDVGTRKSAHDHLGAQVPNINHIIPTTSQHQIPVFERKLAAEDTVLVPGALLFSLQLEDKLPQSLVIHTNFAIHSHGREVFAIIRHIATEDLVALLKNRV